MKTILTLLFLSFFCNSDYLFSQVDGFVCGTTPLPGETIDLSQQGGIYLTADGELKILVVFVRFKDDNSLHNHWVAGQPPPNFNTFIDPNLQTNSSHYVNLTNYYKQMSLGIYKVTGQAIYVETPQNESAYGTVNKHFIATKDVLQNAVDPLINFNEYDNWSSSSNYNHSNQQDGTVDMIIMVWRGSAFPGWSGVASLGGFDPNPPYNSFFYVENGTKLVRTSFGLNSGSGVTVQYPSNKWPEWMFKVAVHEVGHWQLGGNHPYQTYNEQHTIWGILSFGGTTSCANAYERERLAWINPTPITGDILNAPLQDYVTSGTAYKYRLANGGAEEFFYFANHQKLSIYDNATTNTNDKGIFVLHQRNGYNETNCFRVKTSNGQWNWQNPFNSVCFGGAVVPSFKLNTINRLGYNNRDKIPKTGGGADFVYSVINESGTAVCGDWLNGWGFNNAFNLNYNDVFSPYSNPNTHTWSNLQNNFTMQVIAQTGSMVNARFFITNPLAGKPSKPQDLRVGPSSNNHPLLTWAANIEPDMVSYRIYRSIPPENYQEIATVSHNPNLNEYSYIDYEVTIAQPGSMIGLDANYKIKAEDNQQLLSLFSNDVSVTTSSHFPYKLSTNKTKIPTEYFLEQNFPNPFNPSTTIAYSIPKPGFVQLKVYDILGREIRTLVEEIKQAGKYTIDFNAENLASGIYFYRINSGEFSQTNKLILTR